MHGLGHGGHPQVCLPNLLIFKVRKQAQREDLASPRYGSLVEERSRCSMFCFVSSPPSTQQLPSSVTFPCYLISLNLSFLISETRSMLSTFKRLFQRVLYSSICMCLSWFLQMVGVIKYYFMPSFFFYHVVWSLSYLLSEKEGRTRMFGCYVLLSRFRM